MDNTLFSTIRNGPWLEIQTQTPHDLLLAVGEKGFNPQITTNANWIQKGEEHPKALNTARVWRLAEISEQ